MYSRFIIFLCCLSANAAAQQFPDHILDALNARQSGNGIELSWVMSRGVECLGIDVQRSVNGEAFERVFAIGGVCGSAERPEPYRFFDEALKASGLYTYQLSFGSIGEAEVSSTFQVVWESGLSLLPTAGGHQLRVEGVQGQFDIAVFNLEGRRVFQQQSVFQADFLLPTGAWPKGIYIVHVMAAEVAIRQKFAIVE